MKQVLLLLIVLIASCNVSKPKEKTPIADKSINDQKETFNDQSDSLLSGIEKKIYNAFTQGIITSKNEELGKIKDELDVLHQKRNQNLILYWKAYLQYYLAIFYFQQNDRENSEKEIDKGIGVMENMKKKNSEDYALLALLESFGIQFKGMKAMISKRIKDNGRLSVTMDSDNLRGYYVLGSNDFYTPEEYGGGKDLEEYLLKTISLPSQKIENPYLPSWGKEEAYELLIKFYIKKENWGKAKNYFQEAVEMFPESYQINQLASKLVGK